MGTRLPYGTPFGFGLTFIAPDALEAVASDMTSPAATLVSVLGNLAPRSRSCRPGNRGRSTPLQPCARGRQCFLGGRRALWPVLERRGLQEGLRATLTHPDDVASEIREASSR